MILILAIRLLMEKENMHGSLSLIVKILGCTESEGKGFSNGLWIKESKVAQPLINGERVYKRIFIQPTT